MGIQKRAWDSYRRYSENIFEAIGATPLVRLNKVASDVEPEVYAKLEWYSPSGSLKDRIYYNMILNAEERGDLSAGMTVLECSTGNAGIACAFVSAVKGYPCIVVMPEGMSDERKKLMRAYGADLVFTPGGESDVDLALEKLEEIRAASPEKYWVPAQFDNLDNNEAHYLTTGPEIFEQLDGRVDAVVASQGTGGWVSGVGKFLREDNPDVKLYAVEPQECPLLSQRGWGPHGIEGIGDGFVPKALDLSQLSGIVTTTTEESDRNGAAPGARGGDFLRNLLGLQRGGRPEAGHQAPRTGQHRHEHQRYGATLFHHRLVRGGKTRRDSRA